MCVCVYFDFFKVRLICNCGLDTLSCGGKLGFFRKLLREPIGSDLLSFRDCIEK